MGFAQTNRLVLNVVTGRPHLVYAQLDRSAQWADPFLKMLALIAYHPLEPFRESDLQTNTSINMMR